MAHQKLKHLEKPFITSQIPISLLTITPVPGYDPTCQLHSAALPRSSFQGLKYPAENSWLPLCTVQLKVLEILNKKCVEPNLGPTYWNKKVDP